VIAAGDESKSAHRGLAAASAGFRLPMTQSLPRALLVDYAPFGLRPLLATWRPLRPSSAASSAVASTS
jgi:hypothetical protein